MLSDEQDIICLQETFLDDEFPDSLVVGGTPFRVWRRDRSGRTGGGVAILVRKGIDCSQVPVPPHLELVALDIRSTTRCFRLICCYKAPNALPAYVSSLTDCLVSLCCGSSNVPILLGDFNFPKLHGCFTPDQNLDKLSSSFLATVQQLSLVQLNRHPSREGNTNILDLVFCSTAHRELFSEVECCEPFQGSDHVSLSFSFEFSLPPSEPPPPYRNFKKGRYSEARRFLEEVDWDLCVQNSATVDDFCTHILYYLNFAISTFIPLAKHRPPNSLPGSILRMRRQRRRLFATRHRNPTQYKKLSQRCTKATKSYFRGVESGLISGGNIKAFYDHVRRKSKGAESEAAISVDGVSLSSPLEKANAFSAYFSSVFTSDDGQNRRLPCISPFQLSTIHCPPSLLSKVMQSVKPKLSRGPDGIPPYFLKQVISAMSYPLSVLFRWSFTTSTVPASFKSATVLPIWKRKGCRSQVSNYRPITLCSSIAKLQEKIVTQQLLTHCSSLFLISPSQFGFLPKRSLTTQMLLCLNDWSRHLAAKDTCYIVYLDFKKAFDTVSHPKLLSKLQSFGVSGSLLNWIEEYMTGRTQQVSVSQTLSVQAEVTSGIMQGSCLGPVLFVLFINDLLESLNPICKCLAYADDVKLYSNDPTKIQLALNCVQTWCLTWQLNLSVEKCSILKLGAGPEVPFTLGTHVLPYACSVRDLGIVIDKQLSFSEHCSALVKKARRTCGIVLKCFSSGKVSLLLKAYKTYIRPQLESATQVWNSISEKEAKQLESCQRFFTKMLYLKCGLTKIDPERPRRLKVSYEERLRHLGLETLKLRRFKLDLSLCYKIYHRTTFCPDLLVRKTNGRTLQHNHRLQKEIAGKHRSVMYANRVVGAWNALPDSVVEGPYEAFHDHIGL